jgi:hypothetical protein
MSARALIALGKLYANGHGMGEYCLVCQRYFCVPMPVLTAARGPYFPPRWPPGRPLR